METEYPMGMDLSSDVCTIGQSLTGRGPSSLMVFLSMFTVSLLACLYFLIISDYEFYLSLGPGGTPPTPQGYIKVALLHLIARGKKNVLIPPKGPTDPRFTPYFQKPASLPLRAKPRPRTAGLAPHRQITQRAPSHSIVLLNSLLASFASANPDTLQTKISRLEKHSTALFLTPSPADYALLDPANALIPEAPETDGAAEAGAVRNPTAGIPPEVAHMHDSEGSLHLTLHPRDVATVIERGWGERHPLAGRWLGSGFVMVYAPVGEEEVRAVVEIVRAAAWWVGGVRVMV